MTAPNQVIATNWTTPTNRTELETALDARKLYVRMNNGRFWLARRNGQTQTWVKGPNRFRIPVKSGFRATGQITGVDELDSYRIADSNDLANANQYGGRVAAMDPKECGPPKAADYGRGFDRMKKNLGPEKAETLRQQVLKDQQAALADAGGRPHAERDRSIYKDYPASKSRKEAVPNGCPTGPGYSTRKP